VRRQLTSAPSSKSARRRCRGASRCIA
jgi:hypothetical protein